MVYFNRIYAFEGTDVNKNSANDICYSWFFLNNGFRFLKNDDLLMMSMNLSKITILSSVD